MKKLQWEESIKFLEKFPILVDSPKLLCKISVWNKFKFQKIKDSSIDSAFKKDKKELV